MALHKMPCRRLLFLAIFSITVTSAQDPNPGRQQYESRCSRCHGADATGGESGPNIVPQIDALTDAGLASFLRTGRPARGMPAFDLSAQDMAALVGYLHMLIPTARNQPPLIVRKRVQTTTGETIEGRYESHWFELIKRLLARAQKEARMNQLLTVCRRFRECGAEGPHRSSTKTDRVCPTWHRIPWSAFRELRRGDPCLGVTWFARDL
jgi:cytochrome c553